MKQVAVYFKKPRGTTKTSDDGKVTTFTPDKDGGYDVVKTDMWEDDANEAVNKWPDQHSLTEWPPFTPSAPVDTGKGKGAPIS